ncbi:hypothetical protein LEP48_17800 [Isoptericola sp. NEAU-Y5]|uniref:histidine kinase n=1 Tax=Isoptericola luteus TaxID=2879484 RepID=A0ABS7ZJI2_9MICO|nr:ATP-binding protein [Isoptericola sp. NEAU-Y5]MCA5895186.1 hypothetical protein [Isoptericola sp. NEAU-Y5]
MAGLIRQRSLSEHGRVALVFAVVNVALFAILDLSQWMGWGGLAAAKSKGVLGVVSEGLVLTSVNLVFGLLVIGGAFLFRVLSRPWATRLVAVAGLSAVFAMPRVLALLEIGTTPTGSLFGLVEGAVGIAAGTVAVGMALFAADLIEQARTEAQRREEEQARAARAVDELQAEEMRIRRMVSDQLHGTLQYRLVTVTAALDQLASDLAGGKETAVADIRRWAEALEEIRETEVRSLSHAVFPAGLEIGAVEAIELMLRRLPTAIATSVELGPRYRSHIAEEQGAALLPVTERLVAVYAVEEAVTNALKHGRARTVRVRAEAYPRQEPGHWVFEVTVDDDGSGPPDPVPPFHGLDRHRSRIESRGGVLELTTNPDGGGRLHFTLPFRREDDTTAAERPGR